MLVQVKDLHAPVGEHPLRDFIVASDEHNILVTWIGENALEVKLVDGLFRSLNYLKKRISEAHEEPCDLPCAVVLG